MGRTINVSSLVKKKCSSQYRRILYVNFRISRNDYILDNVFLIGLFSTFNNNKFSTFG